MLKKIKQLARVLRINQILARHGLVQIIVSAHLLRPLRFLPYLNPWNLWRDHQKSQGVRIREALEELGPIFVKFGQTLSTRRDLLPDDIADELAKLQDQTSPFPAEVAEKIVESVLGGSVSTLFQSFDRAPLASASIAQVHAAKLWGGQDVVVKVLRPNIAAIIRRDIELMYIVARLVERYWSEGPRLHPVDIVEEFERTIFGELDLLREAASASQLRRNFKGSPLLYVPETYWDYTREQVAVFERIYGTPIANMDALKCAGVNLRTLAENGVQIFFTQVFRDCFFHADMHPGNIFISHEDPQNPKYVAVDFGIMGSLNPNDQRYLAENLLAFFKRDYRRVAELHVESGWVPPETRINEFEAAIRTICEPIFERPLKDISFAKMLLRLFQIARHFQMEVQPQLMLLQKTLFNIEGLGRQLYPELDLWNTAKPFLEEWMSQQVGVRSFLRQVKINTPYWFEKLPVLLYETLQHTKKEQQRSSSNNKINKKPQIRYHDFWLGFFMALLISVFVVYVFMHRSILIF